MKRGISLLILGLLFCIGAYGDTNYKYIYSWDTDIYFGHVIYPEAKHDGKDAVVLREGLRSPEVADLNLPLVPGDTIRTFERRCEIQFDTGTIIRLDQNTELKIETILAQSLSSNTQLTNLLLLKGQVYVMYKRHVRKEIFQIITPNTAVKLNHNSVALIESVTDGSTDILMSEGKGYALYGPTENAIKKESIKKSQKIVVTPDHRLVINQYEEIEDFEAWNEKLNREFLEFHEGKSVIPMPIQKLSRGVYYFAQKYSNLYGEWLWDKYVGYVWRPFLNNRSYPWGGWMPYYQGRWSSVQGQLFWVPSEPWGWVPYHLGIWMWNKNKGWLWIPGSVFAPAWVDWSFYRGYFCWRPWLITDWYSYSIYGDDYFPYFAGMIHPDDERGYLSVPSESRKKVVRNVITKEQLKKKAPPYPIPKELKRGYKRIVVALKNGEDGILVPLKDTPNHMLAVNQQDLNAPRIHEKIVKLTSLSKEKNVDFPFQKSQQDPRLQAIQTYNRNKKIAILREKVTDLMRDLEGQKDLAIQKFQMSKVTVDNNKRDIQGIKGKKQILQPSRVRIETSLQNRVGSPVVAPHENVSRQPENLNSEILISHRSSVRFRDWNPDVNVARRAGISIRYSSRSNEVRCPELNISSRHVSGSRGYTGPRVQLTSRGSVNVSGTSGGAYSGGSSSRSASQGGSSNSRSTNKGEKGASSGSKGGVVKK
ncbi:MAG: FecR domain-containing protein [Candidatus Aminicenantes bacterium]|nr:MAG: FecR domain-containing protein [Candidatus Aminicenantes bacterium]